MGLKGNKVNNDVTHRDREQRLGAGEGRGQFEFQEAPDLPREMFNKKIFLMRARVCMADRGILGGPRESDHLCSLFAVLRLHGGVGHGDLCGFSPAELRLEAGRATDYDCRLRPADRDHLCGSLPELRQPQPQWRVSAHSSVCEPSWHENERTGQVIVVIPETEGLACCEHVSFKHCPAYKSRKTLYGIWTIGSLQKLLKIWTKLDAVV